MRWLPIVGGLVAVFLTILTVTVLGQTESVTGQIYLQFPASARTAYAAGFQAASALSALNPPGAGVIARCTALWSLGQTQAVIDRYIMDNPQRWHEWVGFLAWDALMAACRR